VDGFLPKSLFLVQVEVHLLSPLVMNI